MKKLFHTFLAAASFLALVTGCMPQDLTFSHETPSFDVKDGLILIEAIAPAGLSATDAVYIAGPALGDSATVVQSTRYQMELAPDFNRKWGVYLNPADFLDGKTLADGFYFVVKDRGHERTPLNAEPEHTLNAATGQVYTVYMAGAWSNDFLVREPIDIPDHMNFRVYILDNTGWDQISLYMYGDVNDLEAPWPGLAPAGTEDLDGKTWTYFEIGPAASALTEHLIFNNGGNGAQIPGDGEPVITFDNADYFISVTADGGVILPNLGIDKKPVLEELPEPEPVYPAPGFCLYVEDNTAWPGNLFVHLWTGGGYSTEWPGLAVSETIEEGGKTYKVFNLPGDINGDTASFIFHSDENDGENRVQIDGVAIKGGLAYTLTAGAATAADAPADPVRVFVTDERHWEGDLYLHMWNDEGFSTEWPGLAGEMMTFDGHNYIVFTAPREVIGKTVSAIIHSDVNDNENRLETQLRLDKDRFYTLGTTTIFDESLEYNASTIYVIDQMGWGDDLHMYAWGTSEIFGVWPGTAGQPVGTFCGAKAYAFDIAASDAHKEAHLIFNNGNGGDGNQFDGATIETGENHCYLIKDDFTWEETGLTTRIYVEDNTGWDDLFVYIWGTSEVFGGWPGAAVTATQTIDGKVWKYAEVPADCFGNDVNIIFNNNAGTQVENFDILKGQKANKDFYFVITTDSAALPE